MFAKLTKALLLSTCLVAAGIAGTASADERNLIVPVVAGAAVGALIASNWDNGGHHHHDGPRYAPPPRQVVYVPAPQPVHYRPAPQVVYYRPAPPPPRHWEHQRFDGPRW